MVRNEHDIKLATDLCQSQFQISTPSENQSFELGKKREYDKPRLLKIQVHANNSQQNSLRSAKELRKSNHPEYKLVYICPDLITRQRERSAKLKKELDRKKLDGEKDPKTRRGKIIRVVPQNTDLSKSSVTDLAKQSTSAAADEEDEDMNA